jgi:hypothetical protein
MTKSEIVQLVCGYTTFPSDSDRYRCKRCTIVAGQVCSEGRPGSTRAVCGRPLRVVDLTPQPSRS